jgi:hypothetical protein
MENPDDKELIASLRSLEKEIRPPATLRNRVERSLSESPQRQRSALLKRLVLVWLACTVLLTLVAFGLGRRSAQSLKGRGASREFALLLYKEPSQPGFANADETKRVQEYTGWARKEESAGTLIGGEKLSDWANDISTHADSFISREHPAGADSIAGFFIVRAPEPDSAIRIALRCPHLKYGGRIELRELVRVPR